MSAIWIAALVITAPPAGDAGTGRDAVRSPSDSLSSSARSSDKASEKSPFRRAQELRAKVSKLLRREATTEGSENQEAVLDLVDVMIELRSDKYLTDDERKRLFGTVRSRLLRVSKRIKREVRLAKQRAKRAGRQPESVAAPVDYQQVLAQQLNQIGQQMARGAGAANRGEALLELIKTTIQPDSWDDNGGPGSAVLFNRFGTLRQHLGTMGPKIVGGVDGATNFIARGGRANDDYGEDLVELIQAVIAPQSWDVAGGPGAIIYYRPLRVLVIRQTDEIHGNVGNALGQLRAAGN